MPVLGSSVADHLAAHGYPVLFLLVLLECAGVPVPGETALLTAAFLCSPAGGECLRLGAVIAVAAAAAVLGDNLGYWLGRRVARPRLAHGRGLLLLTPERLARAEGYFRRYGALTVFAARFLAGLRVIAGPAAGAAGMPWPRFLQANAAGAAAWATAVGLAGYYGGHAWDALHRALGRGAWVVVAVLGTALVAWYLVRRLQGRRHPA
jgi:membrane-associated protein